MTEIILIYASDDETAAGRLSDALSALGLSVASTPLHTFDDAAIAQIKSHSATLICWSRRSVLNDHVLDAALFASELAAPDDATGANRYCGVILDDTLRALLPRPFFMRDAFPLGSWFLGGVFARYDDPAMGHLISILEQLTGRDELSLIAQALDARSADQAANADPVARPVPAAAVTPSAETPSLEQAASATPEPDLSPAAADAPKDSSVGTDKAAETAAEPAPVVEMVVDAGATPPAERPDAAPAAETPAVILAAPPEAEPSATELSLAAPDTPPPLVAPPQVEPRPEQIPDIAEPQAAASIIPSDLPVLDADPAAPPIEAPAPAELAANDDDPREGLIAELQMQLAGMRIQHGFESAKFQEQIATLARLQTDLAHERTTAADARTAAEQAHAAAAEARAAAEHAQSELASVREEKQKLTQAVNEARQAYAIALRQQKGLEAQINAGDLTLREVMSQREELLAARQQWEKNTSRVSEELDAVTARFNEAESARKTYELALLDRKTEILSLQSKLEAAGVAPGPSMLALAAPEPTSSMPPPAPEPVAVAAKAAPGRGATRWGSIAAGGVFAGMMLSYAAYSTTQMVGDWLAPPQTITAARPVAPQPAAPAPDVTAPTPPPDASAAAGSDPTQLVASPLPAGDAPVPGVPLADEPAPEGPLGVPVSDQVLFNPDGLPPPDPDTRPPPQDLPPMQQKPRLLLKPPAPAGP
jgi:hypothetical protein